MENFPLLQMTVFVKDMLKGVGLLLGSANLSYLFRMWLRVTNSTGEILVPYLSETPLYIGSEVSQL